MALAAGSPSSQGGSPTKAVPSGAPAGRAGARGHGWFAKLRMGFAPRSDRTVLAERRHEGPLRLLRSFYPEGAPCHSYLIHPPGGIVGGDELDIRVRVEPGAHGVVTTPAANKFYRSAGPLARQHQTLRVEAGGALEWLPQEQIVYESARVESLTRADLAEGAAFISWELTCLGRPAAGEGFETGLFRQRLELYRDGRPLMLERNRFEGGSAVMQGAWGLGDNGSLATLVAVGADAGLLADVRERLDALGLRAAATLMDDLLVVRWLGGRAPDGWRVLMAAWSTLRPALLNRPACEPRIWHT
ncbi:urease accessory protein UreD [Ectothiorhodospiraceae bacterium WFHF3C12]|nr:urease accessory protein UreD [Ectothiorhodospiraceae bacterium WFHF3C12]